MAQEIIKAPDGTDLIRVKSVPGNCCGDCYFNKNYLDCNVSPQGSFGKRSNPYYCVRHIFGNRIDYKFVEAFPK